MYESPDIANPIVTIKNGRLYLQSTPPGTEPQELLPESETDFIILFRDVTFCFQEDKQGAVSKLITHLGAEDRQAKRIRSSQSQSKRFAVENDRHPEKRLMIGMWPCAYAAWIESIGTSPRRNRTKRPFRTDLGALRIGTKSPMDSNCALCPHGLDPWAD
jgi:hypothetical protein